MLSNKSVNPRQIMLTKEEKKLLRRQQMKALKKNSSVVIVNGEKVRIVPKGFSVRFGFFNEELSLVESPFEISYNLRIAN